jgi:hypothetical protein
MTSAYPGLRRIGPFWHYELRVCSTNVREV